MKKADRNPKIVKYRKPLHVNIGMIVFGVIFIYLLACIIHYVTQERITACEVQAGSIAQNNTHKGFAIRKEKIIFSEENGYVNYFSKNKTKVSKKSLVYSIDSSGNFFDEVIRSAKEEKLLQGAQGTALETALQTFSYSYSGDSFFSTYTFKDNLKTALVEAVTLDENGAVDKTKLDSKAVKNLKVFHGEEPGVILYSVDGFEDVTLDSFQASMMDEAGYHKASLKLNEKVNRNDAVYKLVTNENWQLVVPVTESEGKTLAGESFLNIKFKKDDNTAWAAAEVRRIDGRDFLILSFNNSMIRYADERYVSIEFSVDAADGLKIPNSSIVEGEFFLVPVDYVTKGGNTSGDGFLKQSISNGKRVTEFVTAGIYQTENNYYYIRSSELKKGDVLVKPESTENYTLEKRGKLSGVYNINKGYAVFKQIEILYSNEDYSIVEKGTEYGIGIYDHIVLDGSIVTEGDIIDE